MWNKFKILLRDVYSPYKIDRTYEADRGYIILTSDNWGSIEITDMTKYNKYIAKELSYLNRLMY